MGDRSPQPITHSSRLRTPYRSSTPRSMTIALFSYSPNTVSPNGVIASSETSPPSPIPCAVPQTTILLTAAIASRETVSGRRLLLVGPTTSFPFLTVAGFLPLPLSTGALSFGVPNTVLLNTAPHHTCATSFLDTSAESSSSPTPALSLSRRTRKADTPAITCASPSVPGSGSTMFQISSRPSRHLTRSLSPSVSRW